MEALHASMSERQPWLLAAAPFGTNQDGSVSLPEPGWHQDPPSQTAQRWYDGQNWSDDIREAPAQARPDLADA